MRVPSEKAASDLCARMASKMLVISSVPFTSLAVGETVILLALPYRLC